jgi:hypothetical protein
LPPHSQADVRTCRAVSFFGTKYLLLLYYVRAIHAETTIIQISISVKRNFGEAERAELGGRLRTRESPKGESGSPKSFKYIE